MTDVVIKNTIQIEDADGNAVDEVINRTFRCVMDGTIFQAWLQVTDEPEVLYQNQPWKFDEAGSRVDWVDLAEAIAWFKNRQNHEEG